MKQYDNKLIIIRGNSCSGKSSSALALRSSFEDPRSVALIGQDHFRRTVLKELDGAENHIMDLLYNNAIFCLDRGYDVIIEGILKASVYGDMLKKLIAQCPNNTVFYLDVPLRETYKRRLTREDGDQFTNDQMKDWYKEKDFLGVKGEAIINQNLTQEEVVLHMQKLINSSQPLP